MRFRRFAWAVLGFNLAVILWGAFVRATGSGAGCGRHWPLCNGQVVPRSGTGATLIEFVHRSTSGVALLLVLILFWMSRRVFAPGHLARRTAAWALGFVIVEALVGAGLVLFELVGENDSLARAGYLALHLMNTFLLLGTLALTAFWAGDAWQWIGSGTRTTFWLIAGGLAAVLVVAMTGAVTALGDTLFPSGSLREGLRADLSATSHLLIRLRVFHPLLAVLAGLYLSLMVWLVARKRPAVLDYRWGRMIPSLVLLQLGVGLINLLLLAPVTLQLFHLLVADILWIALVLFAATALTASRPATSPAPGELPAPVHG